MLQRTPHKNVGNANILKPTRKAKRGSRAPDREKRRAKLHREAQQRHLARVAARRRCANIEYDDRAVDLLVRLHRLPRADTHPKAAIEAAINVLWNDVVDVLLDDATTLAALMEHAAHV